MKSTLISATLLFLFHQSFAQNNITVNAIRQADSILLISHISVSGSDLDTNSANLPDLMIKNKLNRKVVIESKYLNKSQKDSLAQIISVYDKDLPVLEGMCFISHHSIILIKNRRTSYIDLCFHCHNLETSKDLKYLNLQENVWGSLYNFFKSLGFKYEMGLSK